MKDFFKKNWKGAMAVLLFIVSFLGGGLLFGGSNGITESAVERIQIAVVEAVVEYLDEYLDEYYYSTGPIMTRTGVALNKFSTAEELREEVNIWVDKEWTSQLGDMKWFAENPKAFEYLEHRVGYSEVYEEYKALCLRM